MQASRPESDPQLPINGQNGFIAPNGYASARRSPEQSVQGANQARDQYTATPQPQSDTGATPPPVSPVPPNAAPINMQYHGQTGATFGPYEIRRALPPALPSATDSSDDESESEDDDRRLLTAPSVVNGPRPSHWPPVATVESYHGSDAGHPFRNRLPSETESDASSDSQRNAVADNRRKYGSPRPYARTGRSQTEHRSMPSRQAPTSNNAYAYPTHTRHRHDDLRDAAPQPSSKFVKRYPSPDPRTQEEVYRRDPRDDRDYRSQRMRTDGGRRKLKNNQREKIIDNVAEACSTVAAVLCAVIAVDVAKGLFSKRSSSSKKARGHDKTHSNRRRRS